MNELWLGIKAWTQRIILAAIAIYLVFFVINNSGDPVKFWFWFGHDPAQTTVFLLGVAAFAAGMVMTLLLGMVIKTLRQIREVRARSRHEKMERDLADMKAKAAMLQTKPAGEGTAGKGG